MSLFSIKAFILWSLLKFTFGTFEDRGANVQMENRFYPINKQDIQTVSNHPGNHGSKYQQKLPITLVFWPATPYMPLNSQRQRLSNRFPHPPYQSMYDNLNQQRFQQLLGASGSPYGLQKMYEQRKSLKPTSKPEGLSGSEANFPHVFAFAQKWSYNPTEKHQIFSNQYPLPQISNLVLNQISPYLSILPNGEAKLLPYQNIPIKTDQEFSKPENENKTENAKSKEKVEKDQEDLLETFTEIKLEKNENLQQLDPGLSKPIPPLCDLLCSCHLILCNLFCPNYVNQEKSNDIPPHSASAMKEWNPSEAKEYNTFLEDQNAPPGN